MADKPVMKIDDVECKDEKGRDRQYEVWLEVDPLNFILTMKTPKGSYRKRFFHTIPHLLNWLIGFYTRKKLSEARIISFMGVKQDIEAVVSRVEGIGKNIEREALYYGIKKENKKSRVA